MSAVRYLCGAGLLLLAGLKVAGGIGTSGLGMRGGAELAWHSALLTAIATCAELGLGVALLFQRRHTRVAAVGLVGLGSAFVVWLGIQVWLGSFSGKCSCFGPYDLTVPQHLAVSCGMIVGGALVALLESRSSEAGVAGSVVEAPAESVQESGLKT